MAKDQTQLRARFEEVEEKFQNRLWQHYGGTIYKVTGFGYHSESDSIMVHYEELNFTPKEGKPIRFEHTTTDWFTPDSVGTPRFTPYIKGKKPWK